MKRIILLFLLLLAFVCSYAQVSVKGYYRKNGTYVQPHMRSSPDGNPYNNYSYPGNTNPYTGKVATGNPDTYLKNYGSKNNFKGTVTQRLVNQKGQEIGAYVRKGSLSPPWQYFDVLLNSGKFIGTIGINNETGEKKVYDEGDKVVKRIYISGDNFIDESTANNNNFFVLLTIPESINNSPTSISTTNAFDNPKANETFIEYQKQQGAQVDKIYKSVYGKRKIHLKDKSGSYTGEYLIQTDQDETVTEYDWYGTNGFHKGKVKTYSNGEMLIFDILGKLVKKTSVSRDNIQ